MSQVNDSNTSLKPIKPIESEPNVANVAIAGKYDSYFKLFEKKAFSKKDRGYRLEDDVHDLLDKILIYLFNKADQLVLPVRISSHLGATSSEVLLVNVNKNNRLEYALIESCQGLRSHFFEKNILSNDFYESYTKGCINFTLEDPDMVKNSINSIQYFLDTIFEESIGLTGDDDRKNVTKKDILTALFEPGGEFYNVEIFRGFDENLLMFTTKDIGVEEKSSLNEIGMKKITAVTI